MAKSKETFSKKETEKKKEKKRKEKEQKKEERKANAKEGGKSFDDMIAYMDENGNFSSTPPDPTKRKAVKLEDIEIGVPKQSALKPADLVRKGIVTFFNDSKGYGFIKDLDNQESIFVHINALVDPIKENNKVSFEVEMGQKGPNAVNVKLIN
jgi:cold shock CspA family protein